MWIRRPSEIAIALALALVVAPAQADDLASLRERFRSGMAKYRAGVYGEAITIWSEVYAELGEERGYRLAYDLARAFDLSGDATHAAEHYAAFVDQVTKRRERGEEIEANVAAQEAETSERLRDLRATKGRIHIAPGTRSAFARVDTAEWRPAGFVTYVAPGPHTIIFRSEGTEQRSKVEVAAGELIDVSPPAVAPSPTATPDPVAPPRLEPTTETRTERPYSSTVLFVAAGVTAASTIVPVFMYGSALSVRDDYNAASDLASKERLASDYETARSNAYGSIALPASLCAVTLGLVAYYFFGAKETKVVGPPR